MLRRVGSRGRKGTVVLRELLLDRAPGALSESEQERLLLTMLRRQWLADAGSSGRDPRHRRPVRRPRAISRIHRNGSRSNTTATRNMSARWHSYRDSRRRNALVGTRLDGDHRDGRGPQAREGRRARIGDSPCAGHEHPTGVELRPTIGVLRRRFVVEGSGLEEAGEAAGGDAEADGAHDDEVERR